MPSCGNSQSPMRAPTSPTIRSPINPTPPPAMTRPASQPATMPTMRMTRRLWLERCIVNSPRECARWLIQCYGKSSMRSRFISGLRPSLLPAVLVAFPAQPLHRRLLLALAGREHDDALRRAAGDADAVDRAADQLAAVGDQHDLVAFFDRERRHQAAVLLGDRHGDDAFAAAAGGAVLVGRGALAKAFFRDCEHELLGFR